MKIHSIELLVLKIPYEKANTGAQLRHITKDYYVREGYRSVIYSKNVETLLVKVTTDDGIVGWGEVLAPTSPEVAASVIRTHLAPLVLGEDPLQTQMLWDKMLNTLRVRGYTGGYLLDAMAGLDTACWDIKGKALGQPVWMLLGGRYRDRLRCYVSGVPGTTTEERLEQLDCLTEQGFDALKVHHLGKGLHGDLELLRAIRQNYDRSRLDLMLDGHWNYSIADACSLGSALSELGLLFFEAPLQPEDIAGHRKVAEAISTAVAVGEPLRSIYAFREWIGQGALEVAQPDLGRNGVTETMRIAHLAEAHHLPFAPHLSVHQAVGVAASVHVAAAAANFLIFEYQSFPRRVAEQFFDSAVQLEGGCLTVPTEPGLGVAVKEKELQPYVAEFAAIR